LESGHLAKQGDGR